MKPYAAEPLTDTQRAEVLRVMSYCVATEQHAYRLMLNGARTEAQRLAREEPIAATTHQATAAAFEQALVLLDQCWPVPDLGPAA